MAIRHTLLKAEEEAALLRQAMAGDRAAVDTLVRHNQALVYSIAHRYHFDGAYQGLDDLVQWGNIGLLRAIAKWDGRAGRFSTYATYWIKAAIRRNGANATAWSMSDRDNLFAARIARARAWLIQEKRREPTAEEVAARTGLSVKFVEDWKPVFMGLVDIDGEAGDADARGIEEIIPDRAGETTEDAAMQSLLLEQLHQAVQALPGNEREIVTRHYFNDPPEPLSQIGAALGLSSGRVQQIECIALARLRKIIGAMELSR